ncbi:CLUMA_CG016138, isoform A [Clunio marinus]|uniref:CLUMA_CG016138, isoform A n=1 Tax=Clunio marinus TaxID=568069 RepID=A0A1J1IX70_9DIPT|nr:CLUMA_CG016615, isoform A [Clunio marinus]CRL03163.1 CLUMA_CG016138, isoform A [Clunio marinus]
MAAKKLSEDYANYFLKNNVAKEVAPMISTVENIHARSSEIESIFLPTIQHDTIVLKDNINQILQCKEEFEHIFSQIDNLELLVTRVKVDLQKLETQIEVAEEELDIPEKKMDIFLKSINIFAKPRSTQSTNLDEDGNYKPVDIFKAKDYFNE